VLRGKETLCGWGRFPNSDATENASEVLGEVLARSPLCRGLGRSYGDASLPPAGSRSVATCRLADRLLHFDPRRGVLRAESGLSLRQLNQFSLPRGWFTPVSPGTQFVTLGGLIASDVHGKNHHVAGTVGGHASALLVRLANGRELAATPTDFPDLFWATVGGMGLTCHILEVELRLEKIPSPWLWVKQQPVADLDDAIATLRESSQRWPFTVCWVDSTKRGPGMGRGFVQSGRWASSGEAPQEVPAFREKWKIPFELPSSAISPFTVRVFNWGYYHWKRRTATEGLANPQHFFYPLDAVRNWNRLYGARGLVQYQCVVPDRGNAASIRRLFEIFTNHGAASPICVMKDCGAEGDGMLSFPTRGISLALDLPLRQPETQHLVDALNVEVIAAGGRIYLAKDSLTRPEHFRAMESRLDTWKKVRERFDPERRLRSALSVRLLGDS